MIYEIVLAAVFGLLVGCPVGYLVGRYQTSLLDKIRTLEGQTREAQPAPLEPEKPTVMAGAYQPPREISTSPDKKRGAGLVETKTPELLDWENRQEIEKLSTL